MERKNLAFGPPMVGVVVAVAATLAVAALTLASLTSPARAAITFTVNEVGDATDADTTDDTCDSDAGSAGDQCTLRAAIQEANDTTGATAGEDTIEFSVNTVTLAIGGSSENLAATGDLDITEDLTINGGNVVIDANDTDRAFHVFGPASATVSNVTVQDTSEFSGGGFFVGSGFSGNTATLNLSNSILQDNAADFGGGIFVTDDATANVSGSTFEGNTVFNNGGGIFVNTNAEADVSDSTFEDNEAESNGGGIGSSGILTVERSTFTENAADSNQDGFGSGGGLSFDGGTATLTNTTITSNTTFGTPDSGGGVAVRGGALSLTNTTIADNEAPNSSGGGIGNVGGTVQAHNTIVANNTQGQNGQCSGGVTSRGGNLEFPTDSCGFEVNGNPELGPLADNSGLTRTRALGPDSAAIDVATDDCPPPGADQRGVTRTEDGDGDGFVFCDIGAFEREASGAANPVEISIDDPQVNEGDGGFNSITFTVTLSRAVANTITIDYATQDGTATANSDYASESGTLTFAPGDTSEQFTVRIGPDTTDEPDETFEVNLSAPRRTAPITDQGIGTIIDDDEPPTLSIDNDTVVEGDSGTTDAVFTVTRSSGTSGASTVDFATADGSATTPEDYEEKSGQLNFQSGEKSKEIRVPIKGDTTDEPDETFEVNLSNPQGATVSEGTGRATITDDDPPCTIFGTNGDNDLIGTPGDDVICGLGGNDTIEGLGGEDTILGNEGNDHLFGGGEEDTIRGAEGSDKIFGGDVGGDVLFGNTGADRLSGDGGEDDLSGGEGNDILRGRNSDDLLRGQVGKDVLVSGTGVDELFGGTDNDKLNVLDGRAGDLADGGEGNNDRCASDSGDTERNCEGGLGQAALQR